MTVLLLFPNGVEAQPWSHGALKVSDNHRYLQHADGTPFFWLGDTGWLLPERLSREEVAQYLSACKANGYNVVQVQTVNGVPALNVYGASLHPNGYDFSTIDHQGYGYWQHMDYIIQTAQKNGIYVGMVCIWGGLVKSGHRRYGQRNGDGDYTIEEDTEEDNWRYVENEINPET